MEYFTRPHWSFATSDIADAMLAQYESAYVEYLAGRLHVKFVEGKHAGSIARVVPDRTSRSGIKPIKRAHFGSPSKFSVDFLMHGNAVWDGRKTEVRVTIPYDGITLIGYTGPTVWVPQDKKARAAKALAAAKITDMDGNILSVGDTILYINARYGTGMKLDRGRITGIKAKPAYDDKGMDIITVVVNQQGVESSLKRTETMTLKMEGQALEDYWRKRLL